MIFNSIEFLIFFSIVLTLYFLFSFHWRWLLLLGASYYFYAAWKPVYLILIVYSTLVDYFVGHRIAQTDDVKHKKRLLLISLVSNLGLLFTFKYLDFFSQSIQSVINLAGWSFQVPTIDLVLPVGISFYTFQTLSYTFEVYKGNIQPEKNLGIFALFVSFFPQLVAGPIERPQHLLPQFKAQFQFDSKRVKSGFRLMLWGMFKKVVIADQLAQQVNAVYNDPENAFGLGVIFATYAFAFQIFCDFSGYSDIAIGAARVMGFDLKLNFKLPYLAQSIPEFWRRWHISLSTWFRDYLYIPLGGNRQSQRRTYLNLMIVFVVSGLWHGANWTFVVWGFVHGLMMIGSLLTRNLWQKLFNLLKISQFPALEIRFKIFSTFHLVVFAWIFFRANSMSDAFTLIRHAVQMTSQDALILFLFFILIFILCGLTPLQKFREFGEYFQSKPPQARWAFYIICTLLILNFGVTQEIPFIYFQF